MHVYIYIYIAYTYIYIYTCIGPGTSQFVVSSHSVVSCGGVYFVCDRSKRRNAKRYNFECNCFLSSPPCPKRKVTPKVAPFNQTNSLHVFVIT